MIHFPYSPTTIQYIYFHRKNDDTNFDRKLDVYDEGSIWKYSFKTNTASQVTTITDNPNHPDISNGILYFSRRQSNSHNISSVPTKGLYNDSSKNDDVFFRKREVNLLLEKNDESRNSDDAIYWHLREGNYFRLGGLEVAQIISEFNQILSGDPWLAAGQNKLKRIHKLCVAADHKDHFLRNLCLLNRALLQKRKNKIQPTIITQLKTVATKSETPSQLASDIAIIVFDLEIQTLNQNLAFKNLDNACLNFQKSHRSHFVRSVTDLLKLDDEATNRNVDLQCNIVASILQYHSILKIFEPDSQDLGYDLLSAMRKSGSNPVILEKILDKISQLNYIDAILPDLGKTYSAIRNELKSMTLTNRYSEIEEKFVNIYKSAGDRKGRDKEPGQAADIYRIGIQYSPTSMRLHKAVVDSYYALGKIEDIRNHYQKHQLYHKNKQDFLEIYINTYNIDGAESLDEKLDIIETLQADLEKLITIIPNEAYAHQTLGWLYFQKFSWLDQNSESSFFDDLKGFWLKILDYINPSDRDYLRRSIFHYQFAKDLLPKKSLERIILDQNIAVAYINMGNFGEAFPLLRQRLADSYRLSFRSPEEEVALTLQTGQVAFQLEKHKEAISYLKIAANKSKTYGFKSQERIASLLMARSLLDMEKYEEAKTTLSSLNQTDLSSKGRISVLLSLAEAERGMKAFQKSNSILDQTDQIISTLNQETKEESDAIAVNLSGASTNAQGFDLSTFAMQSTMSRARNYLAMGNYEKTKIALQKKLDIQKSKDQAKKLSTPQDILITYDNLGFVNFLNGKYQKSKEYYSLSEQLHQQINQNNEKPEEDKKQAVGIEVPKSDIAAFYLAYKDSSTFPEETPTAPLKTKAKRRTQAIQSNLVWKYYLEEGLWSEAYAEILKTRNFDPFSFLPAIYDFLDHYFITNIYNEEDKSILIEKYLNKERAKTQILLSRLNRRNQGNLKQISWSNPDKAQIALMFPEKNRFHVAIITKNKIQQETYTTESEVIDYLEMQSDHFDSILLNDLSFRMRKDIKKRLPHIRFVKDQTDLIPVKNQILTTVRFEGKALKGGCYANFDKSNRETFDIRIHRNFNKVNLAYNSFQESVYSESSSIVHVYLLEKQESLKPIDLKAIHIKTRMHGGQVSLILDHQKHIDDLFCRLTEMHLVDAVQDPSIIVIGNPGNTDKILKAPNPENLANLGPEKRLFWSRKMKNDDLLLSTLVELRSKRQIEKRLDSARHFQGLIIRQVEPIGDYDLADELINSGVLYLEADTPQEALQDLTKAYKIYEENEDTYQQALALRLKSIAYQKNRDFEKGREALENAIKLVQDDPVEQSVYIRSLANYNKEFFNDFSKALKGYKKCIEIYRDNEDNASIAKITVDLANTYLELGLLENAVDQLIRLKQYADITTAIDKVRSTLSLMKAFYLLGDYSKSLGLKNEVKDQLEKITNPKQKISLSIDIKNNVALVLNKLGRSQEALELIKSATDQSKNENLPRKISLLLSNWGFILRNSQSYQESIARFNEALAIDQRLKDQKAVAYDYRNLGFSLLAIKQYDNAKGFLENALKMSLRLNLAYNSIYSLLGLSELYYANGDLEQAKIYARQSLEQSDKLGFRDFGWRTKALLGQIALKQNQTQKALNFYENAIQVIESLQASLANKEYNSSFRANISIQKVYEEYVLALITAGKIEESWEVNERSKSRSFIDSLAGSKIKNPPEVYLEYKNNQKRLHSPELTTEEQRSIKDRQKDIEYILQQNHPKIYRLAVVGAISYEEIKLAIPKDTSIVVYMATEDKLLAWVLDREAIKVFTMPVSYQNLTNMIESYRKILLAYRSPDIIGEQIFAEILSPLMVQLNDKATIGFIPHGPLHYLPFPALPISDEYLTDRFLVFNLEHGSMIADLTGTRHHEKPRIVGLGNPDRGKDLDLPFAQREVEVMTRYFPESTLLLNQQASISNLKQKLNQKIDYLHIASHGEFNMLNPKKSRILLAPDSSSEGDLTVESILSLSFQTDLITLSACETGLGDVSRCDEIVSLNRAFFLAGTKSIISTLWRIDDVASAMTMKRFYRYLSEGNSLSRSLQKAQANTRKFFPHPAYWSAFRLSGTKF